MKIKTRTPHSSILTPLRVTVFGGSQPRKGDDAYNDAMELGTLLGGSGYQVLTGGYIGTMEAVSHGASDAGGTVIGITCDEIESWRPVNPNPWVMKELRFPTLRERLYALIENCDVALGLPGGIGTLAEIAVMWSQIQIGAIDPRPLILIGDEWGKILDCFYDELSNYIAEKDKRNIILVPTVRIAFQYVQSFFPPR
jgi:uncharacterized protein (TIGR00730 family)